MSSNGTLCAEGIYLEDVCVDDSMKILEDSLFCVHLQRQYSAQRELQDFLALNSADKKGQRQPQQEKYYQALKVLCF